ncbi:potassium-transporting ATPase subunit C [Kaistella sp. 97-N-M2]|uniref:potassium-transporting ATPase subunit C n=1 Tax=Kaistella sp. 97-N-M2 TaxID=2908645 RepID=UPI001F41A917|nr:potassium-transporting ATPase subunit C [Kaistella sp. 97-N-M2]UJF30083.1 potassium-transporting ATPase subunit C [Kaistella sp. 97-N-M2]
MKKYIRPAIVLTFGMVAVIGVFTLFVFGIAKITPERGLGEQITINGKKQYATIGQQFTLPQYFHGRPSAVDYNAAGSGGSNKGPNNPEYLADVQKRIDTLLMQNPTMTEMKIPVDLITSSGSGLDPNISVPAAEFQIDRVAKARNISKEKVKELIAQNASDENIVFFAPQKVNVLKLNAALENLK